MSDGRGQGRAPTVRQVLDMRGPTVGIYGYQGTGKSTALLGDEEFGIGGMPSPLVLSCEGGLDRFTGVAILEVPTMNDFLDALERHVWPNTTIDRATGRRIFRPDSPYRSVVVDGVGTLYYRGLDEAADNELFGKGKDFTGKPERNPAARDPRAAHSVSKEHVWRAMGELKMLLAPVAFTLHARDFFWTVKGRNGKAIWEDGEPVKGHGTEPDLSPRIRELMENTLDVLAYAYIDEGTGERLMLATKVLDERRKIEGKDRYKVIGTVPNPAYTAWAAKGRKGPPPGPARLPAPRPLAWESIAGPLRELYLQQREALRAAETAQEGAEDPPADEPAAA